MRRLYIVIVLATIIVGYIAHGEVQTPQSLTPPSGGAPPCTPRFDGMYEQKSSVFNYYVRFWKDGTVENATADKADKAVKRLARDRGEGRYSMDGCTFQIEATFTVKKETHTGQVVGKNQIRITSGKSLWNPGTYEFIPVDFESIAKKAEEER
jgi:hypothetical protein